MSSALLEKEDTPVSAGEDDVRQYLYEIRQYPLLTPEQEKTLAMGCARGDAEAIRAMVNSNLRLVVSIAREYAGRGVPLMDLIQEGSIGLLAAAKKFDYTLEYRFSTYATKWIRRGVTQCILNHAGLIRVPTHTAEKLRKILTARAKLLQQTGQEPDVEEISQCSGVPGDKIRKLMQLLPEVCSLDAPVGDGETDQLQLLLEDVHAPQPQEELVWQALKSTIDSLLGMLPERQQTVLRLRFGMEDGIDHSLSEIGTMLGVYKERARQIEHQAMQKLQTLGAGLGLEDFLE